MKTVFLLFVALTWAAVSIHAETPPIDNDAVGLTDLIGDTTTRDLIRSQMVPISPEIEGLIHRVGIRMAPTLRLRDAKEAQLEIQRFFGWLNLISELSSLIEAPQQRLSAERLLAIYEGLHT
jgi:hypothetical protein